MPYHDLLVLDPKLSKMFEKDKITFYQTQRRAEVILDLYQDGKEGGYIALTTHVDDDEELVMGQGDYPKEAIEEAIAERLLDEDAEDAEGDYEIGPDEIVDLEGLN